jgi:hypothetical protein
MAYPTDTEPFVLGHGLTGVHFYGPKGAFYLAYGALQAMRLGEDSLTLVFTTDEVLIEGRGLHGLYVHLAEQKVKRVHEQGERYEKTTDASTFIRRIQRTPRMTSP